MTHLGGPRFYLYLIPVVYQDLVVPGFKGPHHYGASPLIGRVPIERDILLFFKVIVNQVVLQAVSLTAHLAHASVMIATNDNNLDPSPNHDPHQGDTGMGRFPHYSRGIRQRMYMLSNELKWKEKHNVLIGSRDIPV